MRRTRSSQTHFVLSIVAMFAVVAFVALPLTRDIELKTQETFAATGIGRLPFLFGRIGGGFLFALLTGCAAVLGTLVATLHAVARPAAHRAARRRVRTGLRSGP